MRIVINPWKVIPTRYPELGYLKQLPKLWRIVDIEGTANGAPRTIGPFYESKTELLADLHRFASEYGCEV